jgi:hypothetical protein
MGWVVESIQTRRAHVPVIIYSQIIAPNIATDSILATSQIDPILAVYREGGRGAWLNKNKYWLILLL